MSTRVKQLQILQLLFNVNCKINCKLEIFFKIYLITYLEEQTWSEQLRKRYRQF